jgi:hypothetical protein
MRRGLRVAMLMVFVAVTLAPRDGRPAAGKSGPKLSTVTLGVRHRVFHDFSDRRMVRLNQDFLLGDTEYSARVVQYIPDFQMDLQLHKIFSLSNQPNNPAFKIIVRKGKVPQDTTWAFLKSPPHFGARSYFAFQVLRIDFTDHAPLGADTVATTTAQKRNGESVLPPASRDSTKP